MYRPRLQVPCYRPGVGVVVELIKNLLELLVRGIGSQMGFGQSDESSGGVRLCCAVCLAL